MDNPFFVTAGVIALLFVLPLLTNWAVNRSRTPDKWVPILPWASLTYKMAAVATLAYMVFQADMLILGAMGLMAEKPSATLVFFVAIGIAAMWMLVGLATALIILRHWPKKRWPKNS